VDDGFFTMQNMLAKAGWQAAVAASEEEAEERFEKVWPHLIIVDARKATVAKQKKTAFNVDDIIR
jgi:DNA-binding response OmpR family regulator